MLGYFLFSANFNFLFFSFSSCFTLFSGVGKSSNVFSVSLIISSFPILLSPPINFIIAHYKCTTQETSKIINGIVSASYAKSKYDALKIEYIKMELLINRKYVK